MRFNRVRRIANLGILVLLALLFFVPEHYLSRTADSMISLLDTAEEAARDGDLAHAQRVLSDLKTFSETKVPPLKLFMNHEGVDALLTAIAAAAPMEEREDILSAAAGIRAGVEQLRQIECFSWKALL